MGREVVKDYEKGQSASLRLVFLHSPSASMFLSTFLSLTVAVPLTPPPQLVSSHRLYTDTRTHTYMVTPQGPAQPKQHN